MLFYIIYIFFYCFFLFFRRMPGRNPSNEPLGGCKRPFSKEAPRQVERPGRITAASEELIHKETMNKSGSGRRRFSWFLPPNFSLRWFHGPSVFPHGPSNRSSGWGYHMGYQGVWWFLHYRGIASSRSRFLHGSHFSGFVFVDSCFLFGLCLKSLSLAFSFAV